MPVSSNQKIINKVVSQLTKMNVGKRIGIGNTREILCDLAGLQAMDVTFRKAWRLYVKSQTVPKKKK